MLTGGPCTSTRSVEVVPDTFTMPADTTLPISGLGTQLTGLTVNTVLLKAMSLAVPATGSMTNEVSSVAMMSTLLPARPIAMPRSILMLSGVAVAVGVSLGVCVSVAVGVSVTVGVLVTVNVCVIVAVLVGVSIGVTVGVLVAVAVAVSV